MALNRLSTSFPSSLIPPVLELSLVDEVEAEAEVAPEAEVLCSVVSAVCAAEMSLLESAEETLVRNLPKGLLESALDGLSFCTSARYFSASLVSPDLMEDMRPLRAVSKAFLLFEDELETEDEDEAVSCDSSELEFCKFEINIAVLPFWFDLDARLSLKKHNQRCKG